MNSRDKQRMIDTGAFNGELFDSGSEVRSYFTVENMDSLFPQDHDFTQEELTEFADYVIETGYHMNLSLTVHLDNLDRDDGTVLAFVDDSRARFFGEMDQSIQGNNWESVEYCFIYAVLDDYPKLVEDLAREGYVLNLDNYFPGEG